MPVDPLQTDALRGYWSFLVLDTFDLFGCTFKKKQAAVLGMVEYVQEDDEENAKGSDGPMLPAVRRALSFPRVAVDGAFCIFARSKDSVWRVLRVCAG